MLKVDLHVHTRHSADSLTRPEELLAWMERRGIDRLAVTDHNSIEGAFETAALDPGAIIIGEEIRTTRGEIIGLFLSEFVPPELSPMATVDRIRAQGGLVYVPHPMDGLRGSALARDALEALVPHVDLIEGHNARVLSQRHNERAIGFARLHGLPIGAGSDAHRPQDLGLAYVEMAPFEDAAGFMASIVQGRIHGRLVGPMGRLSGVYARLAKRVGIGGEA